MKWNDIGFANLKQSMYKVYDKTNFRIYNPGIEIHPFEQELKIVIKHVRNSTDYFQLKNLTNGSTFRVTESVSDDQEIILDGISMTSNGESFLSKTNKQYIRLSPGWNEFEITGATKATIEFEFPFYYL